MERHEPSVRHLRGNVARRLVGRAGLVEPLLAPGHVPEVDEAVALEAPVTDEPGLRERRLVVQAGVTELSKLAEDFAEVGTDVAFEPLVSNLAGAEKRRLS